VSAGNLKRQEISKTDKPSVVDWELYEQGWLNTDLSYYAYLIILFSLGILIRSVCETVIPKLVAEDIPLLRSLLSDVFPGADFQAIEMERIRESIQKICKERCLVAQTEWVEKLLQLYQIQVRETLRMMLYLALTLSSRF